MDSHKKKKSSGGKENERTLGCLLFIIIIIKVCPINIKIAMSSIIFQKKANLVIILALSL